jgi:hypothetical protein
MGASEYHCRTAKPGSSAPSQKQFYRAVGKNYFRSLSLMMLAAAKMVVKPLEMRPKNI